MMGLNPLHAAAHVAAGFLSLWKSEVASRAAYYLDPTERMDPDAWDGDPDFDIPLCHFCDLPSGHDGPHKDCMCGKCPTQDFAGAAASLADGNPLGACCVVKPSVREDKQQDGGAQDPRPAGPQPETQPRCARCDTKLGEIATVSDLVPGMFCSDRCKKAAEILQVLREHPNGPTSVPTGVEPPHAPPVGLPIFKASELVTVATEYILNHYRRNGVRLDGEDWLAAGAAEVVVSALVYELQSLAYDQNQTPQQ